LPDGALPIRRRTGHSTVIVALLRFVAKRRKNGLDPFTLSGTLSASSVLSILSGGFIVYSVSCTSD
jgi:hypothetical protein